MAILDGIKVSICKVADKTAFEEFDPPQTIATVGEQNVVKYIQAEDLAEYFICVQLQPEFQTHGADRMKISFVIDGGTFDCSRLTPNLIRDRSREYHSLKRCSGGNFEKSKMKFAPLVLSKSERERLPFGKR